MSAVKVFTRMTYLWYEAEVPGIFYLCRGVCTSGQVHACMLSIFHGPVGIMLRIFRVMKLLLLSPADADE